MREVLVLAGGGTGGHVFPLLAVADALVALRPDVVPIFVGTERGMEKRFVPERGYALELLPVLPIRGGGLAGAFRGVVRATRSLPDARQLLARHRPRGVLSIGGYAAGPVSLAARTLGLPLGLIEPNSVIGLANWLIAPLVDRAYTAFELTDRSFSPAAVRRLGVPLREGFGPRPLRGGSTLRLLVLGGSQGASALNELVPQALSLVDGDFEVVHQAGGAHSEVVAGRYRELGVARAQVTPFIDDMPAALAAADLVISRSGASALSEILAVGRPSLLVPYPYASGDHQLVNAEAVERAGAARSLPQASVSVERLRSEIQLLLQDRGALLRMADAAQKLGRPDAAKAVAADFLSVVGLETR